ncbi:insulinase family protein [Peptostreptococcus russellii]|uniref:EF-P 5-aminopentanol modification-associated protein YfmF n=1 Tax=Peptostreptococcus russellii TaxID=215200 RepID=UPI001625C03E|nr:pitrilysin family protein [Peptostreptococcus russellii]MBC2577654.1 insulinase family protein [Peptostreptococcus russellii]
MSDINVFDLDRGVTLALIKNPKFKSNLISIYFARNLKKEEVTKISLLCNMMSIGSKKYPTMKEISRKMDELYGLSMNMGVSKHGEKSLTFFKFLSVSDDYLDEPIFEDVIDFINEIVNRPFIVDGEFNPSMIEIEKNALKDEIEARINDKKSYALLRCIEEMCEGEPYSIDQTGYVDDLKSITAKDIADTYYDFISTSNIYISIEGDFNEDRVLEICKNKFKFNRGNIESIKREDIFKIPENITYTTEIMGMQQGKLVMGYRTMVDYKDYKKYYSLMVGNSIFGGGPHSKLFNNVREKESMCYYAHSTLEKSKGLMLVSAGIELDLYEKALKLVTKELDDVKNGNFSDKDIENAKKSILNTFRASHDSISGESDFTYNQFISDTNLKFEEVTDYISGVGREDIIEAMKNIVEDTVYYIK